MIFEIDVKRFKWRTQIDICDRSTYDIWYANKRSLCAYGYLTGSGGLWLVCSLLHVFALRQWASDLLVILPHRWYNTSHAATSTEKKITAKLTSWQKYSVDMNGCVSSHTGLQTVIRHAHFKTRTVYCPEIMCIKL